MAAFAVQRNALVSDLTDEINRRARSVVERHAQFIGRVLAFEGLAQGAFGMKETVRGHQAINALVRAKMVVVAKPMTETTARVFQVLWDSTVPKFVANGFPKPLALAKSLRVMRAAHDMRNALLGEQLLKAAFATPCKVLTTLIC